MSDRLTHAQAAHVLRRLTFGPFPGSVEAAVERHQTIDDLIDDLLDRPPVPFEPPASLDVPYRPGEHPLLGNGEIVKHWLARMRSDDAAVHERMMWLWHTIFTTGAENITFLLLWKQLRTFHTHATGNLRDLGHDMVVDPAMLQWLDGDESIFVNPNENLARELMELFLLGRGNYTQADVRAAARSLAGWRVDSWSGRAILLPKGAPNRDDTFLAQTMRFTPQRVVDVILDQEACAPFIVRHLWNTFIGGPSDDALVERWAARFRRDYELQPVLSDLLHSDAFRTGVRRRPRSSVEWLVPYLRISGIDDDYRWFEVREMGQVPYYPPSVAGWPDESTWTSSSVQYARAQFTGNHPIEAPDFELGPGATTRALRHCGLWEASSTTTAALQHVARTAPGSEDDQRRLLLRATLLSPEFATA